MVQTVRYAYNTFLERNFTEGTMVTDPMLQVWIANCLAALAYYGTSAEEDVIEYHAIAWGGGKEGYVAFRTAVEESRMQENAAR